jgi:uncharacterized protein involved in oxidation of intracellular sulfur
MVFTDARAIDGLRLALSLASLEAEVRAFFVGEAVRYLAEGRDDGSPMPGLLENLAPMGVDVGCCGTSLEAHGVDTDALLPGTQVSTMQDLAAWTLWADRVLTW